MESPQGEPLNADYAGRKIWLVKVCFISNPRRFFFSLRPICKILLFAALQVPHFVAEHWRSACEKAMNVDSEDVGPVLGSIRITPPNAGDSAGQPQFTLKLDNETTATLPQEFKMQLSSRQGPAMLAFSDNAGHMASEGVVQHRLDVEATGPGRAGGSLAVDPAYRKLSKERHQKASTKTRTIQMMTDAKITNLRRPVGAVTVATKRKAETKRTAMDKEELQEVLFRRFEKQTHWAFIQLQRETNQPTPHLKSVLSEIAVQNKRGPYKDLWELKKEFKTGGNGD